LRRTVSRSTGGLTNAAVSALRPTGRTTALYDALYDASRYLRDAPAARRAVVLLTDGRDEGSTLSVEDGLKVAQETRIPVFCVGVGRVEERVMRRVAKLTSGGYEAIGETTGGSLAGRILAATEAAAREAATVTTAPAAASPAPLAHGTPPAVPVATPDRFSPALLAGVLLALAGLLMGVLFLVKSRRPAPAAPLVPARKASAPRPATMPDDTVATEAPATVFARMNLGDETVERTVFLREQPVLEIKAGPGKGRVYPLSTESATSVGRARANDIALEDEAVSGQHFRIRPEEGGFVLHDLGSTNGTKVNERKVGRHGLQDGDVIRAGDTSLRFKLARTDHS
jgi:hypothetical protein